MKHFLFVIFFVLPIVGSAQSGNLGNWMIIFGNKQFKDKYNWHHELQYRNYNFAGDLEQLLLRTGLGMNINGQANILLGYGFIRSENYFNITDKNVINESRIYQQFLTKQKLGKLRLQHRYRFEQRFIEGDFKLRFRYFLHLSYPLWRSAAKEIYTSVYNEIFLNTKSDPFDRNRVYGGVGYKLNDKVRFELAYLNQFLNGSNRDQINIVSFINW